MVFWICIALIGILTPISQVSSDKKLTNREKKRSILGILGISATLTVLLLIIEYSYLIADMIH
ncbi:hypothetical protein N781_09565 [Pontibacillus halophilus JSM 076056 = DSM 19796]|uniref:Uncharacterized protein n=1 Tax=Pontibacillus halophilus JSM 076056 = DSM 19796 TaxID=1385510 RepID=A0A0A5G6K3_9BACI|nr:hypothetical protein [Pontibacillus halophilus]KGX88756.1 hypothetical protein N781_09565 [Pontibacillus halophilus JSM 076056 = DSM 19796]